jgi:hypothetical protein
LVEPLGLRVTELETSQQDYALTWLGRPAGHGVMARSLLELDPAAGWRAWPELRFTVDGEPAALERALGRGRVVHLRFPLGPSLLARPDDDAVARLVLAKLAEPLTRALTPVGGARGGVAMPIACEHGTLVAVLAPEVSERGARPLRVAVDSPGAWHDFWSGADVLPDALGELSLPAPEGVALLWRA